MTSQQKHYYLAYFKHWLHCVDAHSLHSPFIYQFYDQVIRQPAKKFINPEAENIRASFLNDTSTIEIEDLGAGSFKRTLKRRVVKDIANTSSSAKFIGEFLAKCSRHIRARNIIELGTNLGITTRYLANNEAHVHSVEGSKALHELAKRHLNELPNVTLYHNNIDLVLPEIIATLPHIDIAYVDANHTYEATLKYVSLLAKKTIPSTVIAIGDIHWSEGMEKAWSELVNDPQIQLTVDLFHLGLLFYAPLKEKQHYVLRF